MAEGPRLYISLANSGDSRAWSATGDNADAAKLGILDRTARFRSAGRPIPAGDYVGIILPPGSNNDLLPNEGSAAEPSTGRAGAIFLLPTGNRATFCAANGAGGYVIHSGSSENGSLMAGLPSLVMAQEDLAQLIANLIARSGPASAHLGKPYDQVATANAGNDGWKGLQAFAVSIRRGTVGDASSTPIAQQPSTAPQAPLALMAYTDFLAVKRQVAEGYLAMMHDMLSNIDRHFQIVGQLYQVQFEPDIAKRRKTLIKLSDDAAEVLGLLTKHHEVLTEARDAGDIPATQVPSAQLEQHLSMVLSQIEQLQTLRYEFMDSLALLDRLTPQGRLDPQAEFNIPDVPTNLPGCVLKSHIKAVPPFPASLYGRTAQFNGRAAIYFTPDPTQPNAFRTHVKVLINVNDLRRIQVEEIRAQLPKDSCNIRYSARDDRIYPDPQGRLVGRTNVRIRYGACYSYKYPCWKRWKTYMCRANQWAEFGTINREIALALASRPVGDGFELSLVDPPSAPVRFNPYDWTGAGPGLKDAVKPLELKPTRSFFSEDGTNLWLVLEMAGPGKTAGLPCFAQDQIVQQGAF